MTKETIIKCTCSEIEILIQEHYGVFYETQAAEEADSDTVKKYDIDGELSEWDVRDLDDIINGEWHGGCTRDFMNKLCADGYLEVGTYIIDFGG